MDVREAAICVQHDGTATGLTLDRCRKHVAVGVLIIIKDAWGADDQGGPFLQRIGVVVDFRLVVHWSDVDGDFTRIESASSIRKRIGKTIARRFAAIMIVGERSITV